MAFSSRTNKSNIRNDPLLPKRVFDDCSIVHIDYALLVGPLPSHIVSRPGVQNESVFGRSMSTGY